MKHQPEINVEALHFEVFNNGDNAVLLFQFDKEAEIGGERTKYFGVMLDHVQIASLSKQLQATNARRVLAQIPDSLLRTGKIITSGR
jgi:hypothetical protein